MDNLDKYISVCAGGFGVVVNYIWGGMDVAFTALLSVMVLDFITGVICAGKSQQLDSKKAYLGITKKKMMILIMVALAVIIDEVIGTPGATRGLTIFFYISMEGISILENAAKLDFPIPESLKKILVQLKNQKDDEKEEDDVIG